MKAKHYIFGLVAMLAVFMTVQLPLVAANKHQKNQNSSSSSEKRKKKKCCKKIKQIDERVTEDLLVDRYVYTLLERISQRTGQDLVIDQEILDKVTKILECTCQSYASHQSKQKTSK